MTRQYKRESHEERREHFVRLRSSAILTQQSHPRLIVEAQREIESIELRIRDYERQLANAPALVKRAERELDAIDAKIQLREARVGGAAGSDVTKRTALERKLDRREKLLAQIRSLDSSIKRDLDQESPVA